MGRTTIGIDLAMSDEYIGLLLRDARDALRAGGHVDLRILLAEDATQDGLMRLLRLAKGTLVSERVVRTCAAGHGDGRQAIRLRDTVLQDSRHDTGHRVTHSQHPRVRWILDLDEGFDPRRLWEFLYVIPYFDGPAGQFRLFVSGEGAAEAIAMADAERPGDGADDPFSEAVLLDG